MKKWNRLAAAVLLQALPAHPLLALTPDQEPPPAPPSSRELPTFGVGSFSVPLDIIVRDKKGHAVRDLKASDFEVFEDGVKQKIESFEVYGRPPADAVKVEAKGAPAEPAPAAPATLRCTDDVQQRAAGRWQNERSYSFDFDGELPAGIRCRVTLNRDLKDTAGRPLEGRREVEFSTGGPLVTRSNPGGGQIEEAQHFELWLNGPVVFDSVTVWRKAILPFGLGHLRRVWLEFGEKSPCINPTQWQNRLAGRRFPNRLPPDFNGRARYWMLALFQVVGDDRKRK